MLGDQTLELHTAAAQDGVDVIDFSALRANIEVLEQTALRFFSVRLLIDDRGGKALTSPSIPSALPPASILRMCDASAAKHSSTASSYDLRGPCSCPPIQSSKASLVAIRISFYLLRENCLAKMSCSLEYTVSASSARCRIRARGLRLNEKEASAVCEGMTSRQEELAIN